MNILITGASKGIGKAIALSFCQKGNHNLFLISRDIKQLEELKKQCLEQNDSSVFYVYAFDLAKSLGLKEMAERIIVEAGKIDILINNAGVLYNKKFDEISEAEILSMFSVNFFNPAALIRALLPILLKAGNAHVINIGSMGGFQGSSKYPGLSYYSASKAALAVLTECLAEEYRSSGISFNCLALGAVQTQMFSQAFPGVTAPVKPSEMADFIVDFSQNADRMNGKIIPVILNK